MVKPAPEVEKPTYEVKGAIERVDERDSLRARLSLNPGTPEYDDYYARRPDLKPFDDGARRAPDNAFDNKEITDHIISKFAPAMSYGRKILGHGPFIEGAVKQERERVNIDPSEITHKIKGLGRYLGAAKVRITRLKREWVLTHHSTYYRPELYGKPVELDYEYIICMAFQTKGTMRGARSVSVEAAWKGSYSSLVSVVMAQFIRSLDQRARALPTANAPYLIVPTFVDAGIGEQGRHGIVITKEFGSGFVPCAVATDMPLVLDRPVDFGVQDFCEHCRICAEICPATAISFDGRKVVRGVKKWHINGDMCQLYLKKIKRPCGLCRLVCPWGHPNNLLHDTMRELAQNFRWSRKFLIMGEKLFYGKHRQMRDPEWMLPGLIEGVERKQSG